MPSLPLVSVVICAYNYERYIAEAVDSALGQDYPADRLEIIVVDDGSTDRTPAILAGYGDRIRVIRQENAGLIPSTEQGLRAARGDFIALLDADDAWLPEKTRRQVELLQRRPEVGLVYTDKLMVDADGRQKARSWLRAIGAEPLRGRILGPLLVRNWIGAPTVMFRREILECALPIPREVPFQDHWLAICTAETMELDFIDEPLVRYRVHGDNMGAGVKGEKERALIGRELVWRRFQLTTLPLGDVSVEHLRLAWAWFASQADKLARLSGRTLPEVVRVGPAEKAMWRAAMGAAGAVLAHGEGRAALRAYLVAMACDPFEPHARAAFDELAAGEHTPFTAGVATAPRAATGAAAVQPVA